MNLQDANTLRDSIEERGFTASVSVAQGKRKMDYVVRYSCTGCAPMTINGVLCHEEGCSNHHRLYECSECDACFYSRNLRIWHPVCNACIENETLNPNR